MKKQRRLLNILLYISFVPLLLLLILACYNAIFGYYDPPLLPSGDGSGGQMYYGLEAIKMTVFWTGLGLCIIPVFPICVIFQIVYLILKLSRKKQKDNLA